LFQSRARNVFNDLTGSKCEIFAVKCEIFAVKCEIFAVLSTGKISYCENLTVYARNNLNS